VTEQAGPAIADGVLAHLRKVTGSLDLSGTPYRHLRLIGRGGMGAVHLVHDTRLGRDVALKVLDVPGGDLAARLMHEARVLARLEHPNIVPVHDTGRLPDGRVYYAMKYVRGDRLDEWLARSPPRPAVLRLFQRVCEAVAFAHARGVVHRDLKPHNVMVGAFGEALVVDWGLARELAAPRAGESEGASPRAPESDGDHPSPRALDGAPVSTLPETTTLPPTSQLDPAAATADTLPAPRASATRTGTILGTPGYMAPEQVRGQIDRIDARSDVFALGAILYFLLSGQPAFQGDTVEQVLARSRDEEPTPLRKLAPDVPRPLAAICHRALAKAQEARYASAKEMAEDVAAWLDGLPVSAHRETLPEKLARLYGRYQALAWLLAAYLVMRALVFLVVRR
jgi:serine/threonine protein kinase